MMTIITQCPWCGEEHEVEVPFEGYLAWQSGASIQVAMPQLSADEREMLISGICPKCWAETFGEDEEDPEDYDDADLEMGFDPYEGCYTFDC